MSRHHGIVRFASDRPDNFCPVSPVRSTAIVTAALQRQYRPVTRFDASIASTLATWRAWHLGRTRCS